MLNPPFRPSGVESKGWGQERLETKGADGLQVTITHPHPSPPLLSPWFSSELLVWWGMLVSFLEGIFFSKMFDDGEGWEVRDDILFLNVKTAIFKIDFIKMFVKLVTSFKGEPNTSWIFFETWRSLILLQDHSFVADESWYSCDVDSE